MFKTALLGLIALPSAIAFPWMGSVPNMNGDSFNLFDKRQTAVGCYAEPCCPNNKNHPGAAPLVAPFLYLGAKNGLPATKTGNIEVPADADKAHAFQAPGPNDIRGPCPGLNTMANHHVSRLSTFPRRLAVANHPLSLSPKLSFECILTKKRSLSATTELPTWQKCSMHNRIASTLATTLQWR